MNILKTTSKTLHIVSILILLLPFVSFRSCNVCNKCEVLKNINDSIFIKDSISLTEAKTRNLNSDSLNSIITKNKRKTFDTSNDTCLKYDWDILYGYMAPIITPNYVRFFVLNDETTNNFKIKTKIPELILIDIAILTILLGLIFMTFRKLRKHKYLMILSLIGLIMSFCSIIFPLFHPDIIIVKYGLWILLLTFLFCLILDTIIYKKEKSN